MNYKKGFIAPLLLILVAILVFGGGAYTYVQNKQINQPVTVPQATSTAQTSDSQAADWNTYRNDKYGFTLLFPKAWGKSLTVASQPERFSDGSAGESVMFNYGGDPLFTISVFTRSQWNLRLKDDYPNPVYLAENSSFVFAYTATQNGVYRAPSSVLKDVEAAIATFKLQ